MTDPDPREPLGRLAHAVYRDWQAAQPGPMVTYWPWDRADPAWRELLMRIGHAVANYALTENAATYGLACPRCAGFLDRASTERERAERAEAKVDALTAMARDAKTSAPSGMTAIVAAERVLAAAGGDGETPRPWTAADERGRILAIAECLKSEFTVTARNSEGTRTVTVQAVPYEALRSMALLGDGPGERAAAERLRALGVTGEAQERGEDEEARTS